MESFDLGRRDKGIVGSVEHQHLAGDLFRIVGSGSAEASVETDDAVDLRARPGEFEDAGAAEAIADRRDFLRIGLRQAAQHLESRLEALAEEGAVLLVFSRFLARLGRLGADPLAVDVEGEDVVAEAREHFGAHLFVIREAGPLVHDEDGGALSGDAVIVDVPALAEDLAHGILDRLAGDGGGERRKKQGKGEGGEDRAEWLHRAKINAFLPSLQADFAGL